ncbi:MAG TPA: nitronate monooxygenase [Candidatus Avidehalobacter gallistercoris]|uniref:Probable nitronate monooxygenase n=1 Tax=Candidatus Avidehalobacter gallistercoris TaxID=2840694 RepID=A0A9D1KYF8_9FIRM|nr:nitronate monooxygenase [Candidatus Avidehalobacter gallistercoris]
MSINSILCRDLGLKYPIFQGGMAYITTGVMAAASSNAGGLGLICSSGLTAQQVADEITAAKRLTDKPFGVNLMLQSPEIEQILQIVIDTKIPVVTTGAGDPTPFMPALHEAGIKVIPVIPHVKAAVKAAKAGAYAVVAEGTESGGHVGDMTTLALVPQVLAAVDIPVLAAGGIADGKSLAAMLLLGAAGVQIGTLFMVADECPIDNAFKQQILQAADTDTIVTGRGTPHVVRSLKNSMSLKYAELEKQPGTQAERDKLADKALLKAVRGDMDGGCLMAGQISGLIKHGGSIASIMQQLMNEAEAALAGANKLLD